MFEKIKEILSDFTEMEISDMTADTKLTADMGLNSLDVVNIVVAFEDEFDIEIPDRDIKNFHTIGDIVAYLEDKGISKS
jgi:acyl carrier protein